jgi:hypothetical protein
VTERYARIMPGALAKAAAATLVPVESAATSHESPTPFSVCDPQLLGINARAMQDSNLRPMAPEASALSS